MSQATEADTDDVPTFEAIIAEDVLGEYISVLTPLVDEAKLRLTDDGLTTTAVDPANVGMVKAHIDDDVFESFTVADEGHLLGVELSRLEDIVSIADTDQLIHMELDPETRKLHFSVGGLEYTMALIDPDTIRQEPDIPDLELPATIMIEDREINRALTAADMVSDHVVFRVDEADEQFYIDAEGDTDDVHLELGTDDLIDLTAADAQSLFSLDYLKDMNKAIDADAELQILLGEEFPMKIWFDIAKGHGRVLYMLAPRIKS